MKDDEGMVVLTQKSENENLTKHIFRVTGGNERSFTLIKPQGKRQGNDRIVTPKFRGLYIGSIYFLVFLYIQLTIQSITCQDLDERVTRENLFKWCKDEIHAVAFFYQE